MRPRDGKTFQRQSASWSTTMKPHGSRAGYEPLRTHYASSAPRMLGVHQPLTVEAGQSPPNKSPGSQSQVQQPFIPKKFRTADILLAIPGRRETMLLKNAGVSAATGRGKPITPTHKVVQNLPASRSCREPWIRETKKNATSALIQLRTKPCGIKNMPHTKPEDFCPQPYPSRDSRTLPGHTSELRGEVPRHAR